MTKIKEILFEGRNEKVTDLETYEIYQGKCRAVRCLLVCGGDEVIRISSEGKLSHATRKYYLDNCKELKKVTSKIRIIVDS